MKRKKWSIYLITIALTAVENPTMVYGAWIQDNAHWLYQSDTQQSYVNNSWLFIDNGWYYFNSQGYMLTGWQKINEKWYFLNPVSDGTKGKMLTGWQWIDGKCYYLSPINTEFYPEGAMYAAAQTPDCYFVDVSGAWIDDKGNVQYTEGKGIQTIRSNTKTVKISGGGSGGSKKGSSGGGNSSHSNNTPVEKPEEKPADPGVDDTSGSNDPSSDNTEKKFTYTIKYLDIESKSVLKITTGQSEAATLVMVDFPAIDGYQICSGQKQDFLLTENGMEISIYYSAIKEASPSEAKKVSWEIQFIEEGNSQNEIFKSQKGKAEENTEITIDFPETILGTDQYYYHSLVSSPYHITVNGTGIQKYWIEFRKGEKAEEESDPDEAARESLKDWLKTAREADFLLTGQEPSDRQLITANLKESNERLLNLAATVDDAEPHEIYLIAKGHTASSLILSQTFHDIKNVSELVMEELEIEGEAYTITRVSFTRTFDSDSCNHDYRITDKVEAHCLDNGHETAQCKKCGWEETVILPASGHTDTDRDGICDICYEDASEVPEAAYYNIGDVQARNIGGKLYLFRCIDDDYEDAMNNSQKSALFLCDSVIRSDVDSTSTAFTKLSFGEDNNYKYSDIRKWLQNHAADKEFIHNSYIGITQSYTGSTGKGTYEQFDESSLTGYDRQFQLMEDKIFCLSVEEAVKYRDYLWRFHGSDANNPESQLSAYSKGYYLRSPQKGSGIYVVDLADGFIHPVEVTSTEIGIRPAMTIPQGG